MYASLALIAEAKANGDVFKAIALGQCREVQSRKLVFKTVARWEYEAKQTRMWEYLNRPFIPLYYR